MSLNFLESHLVGPLVADKPSVKSVEADASITQITEFLNKNDFLSVPVWDSKAQQYIGMLGTSDILRYTLSKLEHELRLGEHGSWDSATARDLLQKKEPSSMIVTVEPSQSLEVLLDRFVHCGCTRALVGARDPLTFEHVYKMVSLTDVLGYIDTNLNGRVEATKKRVADVGLLDDQHKRNLVVVSDSSSAMEAFKKVKEGKHQAAAIINDEGKLVGSLSASDLRGLDVHELRRGLSMPVISFLQSVAKSKRDPISCTSSDTLGTVISKMNAGKVHQVWLTDSASKPISYVSQLDVVKHVVSR